MAYKLSPTPYYELECIAIINNILNDTPIKSKRDEAIQNRVKMHKATITQFYKRPIAIEEHVHKNINFMLPPFESNGKQLADFLFKQYTLPENHYAAVVFHHIMSLEHGVNSKETAIIDHLDQALVDNTYGQDTITSCNPAEFFALVEKSNATIEDKMAAMHLYYNFDMYLSYLTALLAHAKDLYCQACPNAESIAAPLMDILTAKTEADGIEFAKSTLGIVPDENDMHHFYPSLHRINTFAAYGIYGTNDVICEFGLHLLELIEATQDKFCSSKAEEFLKCISDSTKLNILRLLKKEPMYGSQLAKELKCTSANISHHMNALLSIGVIRIENENNRLYAHLQSDRIHAFIDGLKELF